jgi:hypothetical protein
MPHVQRLYDYWYRDIAIVTTLTSMELRGLRVVSWPHQLLFVPKVPFLSIKQLRAQSIIMAKCHPDSESRHECMSVISVTRWFMVLFNDTALIEVFSLNWERGESEQSWKFQTKLWQQQEWLMMMKSVKISDGRVHASAEFLTEYALNIDHIIKLSLNQVKRK